MGSYLDWEASSTERESVTADSLCRESTVKHITRTICNGGCTLAGEVALLTLSPADATNPQYACHRGQACGCKDAPSAPPPGVRYLRMFVSNFFQNFLKHFHIFQILKIKPDAGAPGHQNAILDKHCL